MKKIAYIRKKISKGEENEIQEREISEKKRLYPYLYKKGNLWSELYQFFADIKEK